MPGPDGAVGGAGARPRVPSVSCLCDTRHSPQLCLQTLYAYLSRETGYPPRRSGANGTPRKFTKYPQVRFARGGSRTDRAQEWVTSFEVTLGAAARVRLPEVVDRHRSCYDLVPKIPGFARVFRPERIPVSLLRRLGIARRAVAVYGKQRRGFEMARAMTAWTERHRRYSRMARHDSP